MRDACDVLMLSPHRSVFVVPFIDVRFLEIVGLLEVTCGFGFHYFKNDMVSQRLVEGEDAVEGMFDLFSYVFILGMIHKVSAG